MKHGKKSEDHDVTRKAEPTSTVSFGFASSSSEREFHRGEVVGRYVVLEPIGRGGMGVVLAAYDPELDRKVAIKLLHAGAPGSGGENARLRLQREARAMAKLSHPNVVMVHDVGLFEGEVFVAMEFVRGKTLAGWREEHAAASWREVVEVFLSAGVGLKAGHEKGLVHRDFKPDNVLIARDGSVKVTDFGLARAAATAPEPDGEPSDAGPDANPLPASVRGQSDLLQTPVTLAGTVVGTPAYLPPEGYGEDGHLDARSDQFAFCVALWDALFGAKPYTGTTYAALLTAMAQGKLKEPSPDHSVPQSVVDIVRRGLQPLPQDRWPSMDELLAALRAEIEPASVAASPWRTAAWVSVPLALVLAGLLWWNYRANLCAGVDEALGSVWSGERRQALAEAASRAEGPGTETLGERVLTTLDSWAGQWSAVRVDACRATRVRGEQSEAMLDLRMACLDRKLAEMDEFLTLLTAGDGPMPESVPSAASLAARIELCSDRVALAAPFPPPEGEEVAAQVEEVRRRFGKAEALLLAGQPTAATQAAAQMEALAQELAYEPVKAEASELVARTLIETGAYEQAKQAAERSLSSAMAGKHEYYLVRSMTHLMVLEGSVYSDFPEAERWHRLAVSALERVGSSRPILESRVANGWGGVLYSQGDLEASLESFRRSYELEVAVDGTRTPDSLGVANNIVVLLYALGRVQESYDRLLELRDTMASILGPEHPHMATVLSNLAEAASALGHPEECLEHAQAGLQLATKVFGSVHPARVTPLNNAGDCLTELGRYRESLEHHEDALAIVEELFGEAHPSAVITQSGRARALSGLERHDDAVSAARQAVDLGETLSKDATGGAIEPWIDALVNLSRVQRAAGQAVGALAASQQAEQLLRDAGRDEQLPAGEVITECGNAWLAAGEAEEAKNTFERALALLEPQADETAQDPVALAEARLGLSRVLEQIQATRDDVN